MLSIEITAQSISSVILDWLLIINNDIVIVMTLVNQTIMSTLIIIHINQHKLILYRSDYLQLE